MSLADGIKCCLTALTLIRDENDKNIFEKASDLGQCIKNAYIGDIDPLTVDKAIQIFNRFVATGATISFIGTSLSIASSGGSISDLLPLLAVCAYEHIDDIGIHLLEGVLDSTTSKAKNIGLMFLNATRMTAIGYMLATNPPLTTMPLLTNYYDALIFHPLNLLRRGYGLIKSLNNENIEQIKSE